MLRLNQLECFKVRYSRYYLNAGSLTSRLTARLLGKHELRHCDLMYVTSRDETSWRTAVTACG